MAYRHDRRESSPSKRGSVRTKVVPCPHPESTAIDPPQVGPEDRAVVRGTVVWGMHPAVERRARHGQHLRGREDENDRPAPHA